MAEGDVGCTESESGYSSLYSRHSRNHLENVSMEICTIMTRLGYGEEVRRWRVEKWREFDRLMNAYDRLVHARSLITNINATITAGSKAEGLTCIYENDWDVLLVLGDVLCVEADINLLTISDNIDVYRMDTMDTRVYPGHCRLLQERPAAHARHGIITQALCDNGYGGVLLSSRLLLDEFSALQSTHNAYVEHHERAGPSMPDTIRGFLHVDKVIALRCYCPSILQRWADRRRNWPSPTIVQKVVSLGALVTPVGFKGSDYKNIEWRICFNTGEAELINNLNETQAKQHKWVADITDMLEGMPNVFLRLEKIRKAIVASPEPMMWFSKTRMELEMLQLEHTNRALEIIVTNGEVDDSDSILEQIGSRMRDLSIQVAQRMFLKVSPANQLDDIINRMLM
ncbi:uncharacterized protein LOC127851210 [Dreissena polymorpha]|uniref:uncharacterized protein LOC127851210 n=1 Tax=Dreissena polymorpha TaxID=45954 RepID=UPI0022655D9F|nr:uncharacterized protein LOC127851210 [Dreissena polymorpha]